MTETHTLSALLSGLMSRAPHDRALIYGDRAFSYTEIDVLSRRLAHALAELGVGEGDRVALWLPNSPAWLACFFACTRLGAIALATNTRFRAAEMEDILGRAEAKVLIYWPAFRGIDFNEIVQALSPGAVRSLRAVIAYREAREPNPPPRLHGIPVYDMGELAKRPPHAADAARPDAGCLMFTTSGTTKTPKFVLHDQRSIVQHALDVAAGFGYRAAQSVGLGVLPFCGTYGFSTALGPIAAHAPLVIASHFDATQCARLIRRHQVTNLNLSGDMIAALLASGANTETFATVRFCGCGSGCPQWIEAAAKQGLRISGVYGSSEVQALFSHHDALPGAFAERALGGGWPVSARARIRARDSETGALLPHGQSGALEIHAPSQLKQYFGNPQATRELLTGDGYVRTGDLGYTLADGRFIYQARMGDALRLGGFLVSPVQIESVLEEHPAVRACQVVGVETEHGVRAVAFVTLDSGGGFDESGLLAFARSRMARYKVPERIVCLDSFPTVQSANAIKVQKAKLRDMAQTLHLRR
jgi:fatty-acyl-CoA synthase